MSTVIFPDTNVLLRYLLADVEEQYQEIRPFFEALKQGRQKAVILSEVFLETFYVLTKTYGIPTGEAAEALKDLLLYKGVLNRDKSLLLEAFNLFLESKGLSLLDCFLCIKARKQKGKILTFDEKLKRKCS
ncbi:PIN domain-containing protein [Thermosulfurimonas sp. F29]|uniref:PIN domain-containing protein n=1 Tax=Thermosulfurimonas sp. F29 TaxID=2867247 RepID=UPI001C837F60|nr:PIN domain-containing protein [Thermosulfurimonas sp. F29]MBX6424093.1 PIN domain-containing protein [Thermosulfurimonas sp. F29]